MIDHTRRLLLLFACLLLAGPLQAKDEKPLEPAEPPYEEGDLLGPGGHDESIGGGISMNFRLVDGYIRIYFVDQDRLIVEPPFDSGSVRFSRRDIEKGRIFYPVERLKDDLGLGTYDLRYVPFIAFTVVTLSPSGGGSEQVVSFRYNTSTMDPGSAGAADRNGSDDDAFDDDRSLDRDARLYED